MQTYAEKYAPQTSWGQMLSLYFSEEVSFVNRAVGGRSTGNFLRQGRLNEVLCEMTPGDYVLIEFGHVEAMRETVAETGALLIALNAVTVDYFTKLKQEFGAGITNDIIYNYALAG